VLGCSLDAIVSLICFDSDNPHGLLCLSTQIQNMVLACPSVSLGHVRVELYGLRKTQVRAMNEAEGRFLCVAFSMFRIAMF
jgi:hypothetical protein